MTEQIFFIANLIELWTTQNKYDKLKYAWSISIICCFGVYTVCLYIPKLFKIILTSLPKTRALLVLYALPDLVS